MNLWNRDRKDQTDEQLIKALQRGDTDALEEIYNRYARRLYAFCLNTTRYPPVETVEDLVQDVFLRVIKAAGRYDPVKATFRTWLFAIARNRCIDFIRRDTRAVTIPLGHAPQSGNGGDDSLPFETLADLNQDLESTVKDHLLQQAISECIAQLQDDEERQALLLYYFASKVYREIAEILNRSISTVKNRVHNALEKVRRCLVGKGVDQGKGSPAI